MHEEHPRGESCPNHFRTLEKVNNMHGGFYECPVSGCDVGCWCNATSTPADKSTRQFRQVAHVFLDALWKNGMYKRDEVYENLCVYLGSSPAAAHIGKMGIKDCQRTIKFAEFAAQKETLLAVRKAAEKKILKRHRNEIGAAMEASARQHLTQADELRRKLKGLQASVHNIEEHPVEIQGCFDSYSG